MKNILLAITMMFAIQTNAQGFDIDDLTTNNVSHSNLPGLISDAKVNQIMCGDKLEIKDVQTPNAVNLGE